MASAVSLRGDYSAAELRRRAATGKNVNQSRRLLSLAAVLDGMSRTEAARIGMDRQTQRDWVRRGHSAFWSRSDQARTIANYPSRP